MKPFPLTFVIGAQVKVTSDWSKFKGQMGKIVQSTTRNAQIQRALVEFDNPVFGKAWFSAEELKGVS